MYIKQPTGIKSKSFLFTNFRAFSHSDLVPCKINTCLSWKTLTCPYHWIYFAHSFPETGGTPMVHNMVATSYYLQQEKENQKRQGYLKNQDFEKLHSLDSCSHQEYFPYLILLSLLFLVTLHIFYPSSTTTRLANVLSSAERNNFIARLQRSLSSSIFLQ